MPAAEAALNYMDLRPTKDPTLSSSSSPPQQAVTWSAGPADDPAGTGWQQQQVQQQQHQGRRAMHQLVRFYVPQTVCRRGMRHMPLR
jgi:hypothetical protein